MNGPGTPLTAPQGAREAGAPGPSRSGSGRIVALDALRGIAVAGIALMNVYVFALPSAAYFNPAAAGSESLLDWLVWGLSFVFVEDKFRSLFAMLFGAGVLILLERAEKHGIRAHGVRMLVLFAIGAAHAILLANNDVLRLYAMAGLFLPLFTRLAPMNMLVIAGMLMALHVTGGSLLAWLWASAPPGSQNALYPARAFGAAPDAIAYAQQIGTEGFDERIVRRITRFWNALETQIPGIPSTLAMMLVGAALWQNGLLRGEWPQARAFALARRMALLALPALALCLALDVASGFDAGIVGPIGLFWSIPFDLLLAVGYAALVMGLLTDRASGLRSRLATVGRLSLTNYLLTSLTFALIFYGWGAGLFGALSRWQAFAIAFVPIVLMLVWSPPWLARFGQGPFEWLWRSLASGKPRRLLR
ncbi:DUF418 domain-containing protein [Alteriqipengyuania lutimaris]|uniref:DUF418 domain-containing protein n=1 Tax=Alteriqipengyuania lutimaris TaxID=1538146 RepID=UPI0015F191A5|nr:DUF418 domain-containing protein [Alteriqipengyuania lutimaris]MBB3034610.1 uncharacterized protein [Alteriqipengyuania lutimaris]